MPNPPKKVREGYHVKKYLEQVGTPRKPGRRPNVAAMETRLKMLETSLHSEDDALQRLLLMQSINDLNERLGEVTEDAEEGFVKHAASFGRRNGITYATWREAGVPAAVLKRAGITPSGRPKWGSVPSDVAEPSTNGSESGLTPGGSCREVLAPPSDAV